MINRVDAAVARRDAALADFEAAAALLRAAESRYAGTELAPYIRNFNKAQDEWERAVRDLTRERLAFKIETSEHWKPAR